MFYNFIKILVKIIILPLYRVKVFGKENIPKDTNYVLCANHMSMWDPILLAGVFDKPISFMAKKELFDIKLLKPILKAVYAFPVDRQAKDLKAMRRAISTIKSGKTVGIFPEGTRVKTIDRKNLKDGAAYVVIKAKSDIVPVEIISSYKPFKRTEIYFKKPLEVENYLDLSSKEAMVKLMDDTFEKIYEKRKILESK